MNHEAVIFSRHAAAFVHFHIDNQRDTPASDSFQVPGRFATMPASVSVDPVIGYASGNALMARGSQALNTHVAARLEAALGKPLPQMEIRFDSVSISADITVKDMSKTNTTELPTLANVIKMSAAKLVAKTHVVKKQILHEVSGVVEPGTMTLVLGQPGSGKSSLLKLLSGRLSQDKNMEVNGQVTYSGAAQDELLKCLPQVVSYVSQNDKHLPALTVKETLAFAHACSGGSRPKEGDFFTNGTPEENMEALKATQALFKHHPDVIIQQLGLESCQSTIVGDAMLRGVSGGERKRVTMGEMAFSKSYVAMLDEISTGLDSAATFDIISTQRSLAKTFHKAIVISLLQPSPEVFALFDDVILLNEGYVMYHGLRSQVQDYFESLGLRCPRGRDVADFLLDLGTDKQRQYEVGTVPRSAQEYAAVFQRSAIHHDMLEALRAPVDSSLVNDRKQFVETLTAFQHGFWAETKMLAAREMTLVLRNQNAIKTRLFMALFLGLLNGSTFYQFQPVNSQVVMGIAFTAVNTLSLAQATLVPAFLSMRDVLYKQRRANFFRVASFTVASSLSQIPLVLAESVLFGTIMYWMCGFVPTAPGYFLFELVVFLTNVAFTSIFFFIAAASPNVNVANPVAMLFTLFFVLFSGFVITKETIPDYLIWVYWMSPLAWGVRAIAVIQYSDSRFELCSFEGVDYCEQYGVKAGDYLLSVYGVPTAKFWVWYGLVYLVALYMFFLVLASLTLEYWRYEDPGNVVLDDDEEEAGEPSLPSVYSAVKTPKGETASHGEQIDTSIPVTREAQASIVPVTVAFQELWYSVPDPKNPKQEIDLLKGIDGFALPGTITALMGSSGAGKTTLMDVIAGRKTGGKIRGQILLNGHPATKLAIRRATGYCEQMDIHSDASTFREALAFSAFLRQGADVSESSKYDSVNECLELLGLNSIADQIIRGSSTEQMKRLTIGVELAAQPSVLFLDEPTSGLDARSAKLIMDGVRKVADTGRTIVCTIHQPSALVFTVFDSLLLLKRGGQMVYFGELGRKASKLIAYFEAIDTVDKLKEGYNPATWMLEVIGAGIDTSGADKVDFVELFKASDKYHQLQANLDREGVAKPSLTLPALAFGRKRAATNATQARFLVKRFFDLYWRTASYNLTRFIISIVLGVVFGIAYVSAEYSSYQGINSGLGMVYMTTSYITFITFNGVLPIIYHERTSFYRERAAETYNAFWYFVGATVVEVPYCFMSTLLFMIIFFPVVGFTGAGNFFAYWLNLTMLMIMQSYFGQFLSYSLPSLDVASIFTVLIQAVFVQFVGFTPPVASIPHGYKWLYHMVPHTHTFASLTAIAFGACSADGSEFGCQQMSGSPPSLAEDITVQGYLETIFAVKHSEIWMHFGIVVAWVVFFRIVTLLALQHVNYQKR
jgi:ABC-type multidrug transport system ATPase subunit/ABC-type multidrug transport system permease subunit